MSVARAYRSRTARPMVVASERSNAAIPVAVVLVALGLYLGTFTLLLTAVLGFVLLVSAGSLLSSRLNPLSASFYLTRKPSFLAIGVVFLGALILFGGAYALWIHQTGPLLPRF
jgi:uncharacterized membrane protein